MPNPLPKRLNQKSAKRLLEADGWTEARQPGRRGKHQVKMTKPGERPITLPHHKGQDYAAGLTAAILRQAGLRGPGGDDG